MPAVAPRSRSTADPQQRTARASTGPKAPVESGLHGMLGHWLRWLLTLIGGVLTGAGLVLHGQVAIARVMREELANTFFLWRAVGESTIFLQGGDVRLAFAMREVPTEVLRECDLAAWTLVAVGGLIALAALLLPQPHRQRK